MGQIDAFVFAPACHCRKMQFFNLPISHFILKMSPATVDLSALKDEALFMPARFPPVYRRYQFYWLI